jgi:hypothetical protein
VSRDQRNHLFGHSDDSVFQRYYQSNISLVDIKGIVLRGQPDNEFDAICMALRRSRRFKPLPTRLPSRANQELLNSWREATWKEPESRDALLKRAKKTAWESVRETWKEPYTTPLPPVEQGLSRIPRSIEKLGNLDDPVTKGRVMMKYDKHRDIVATATMHVQHSLRDSTALDDLVCLAKREYCTPTRWYPGEKPMGLSCAFCKLRLDR